MKPMKVRRRLLTFLCLLVSLAVMVSPYGVALTFAPSPEDRVVEYYSYFSRFTIGYGDWFAPLAGLLAAAALILLVAGQGRRLKTAAAACTGAAAGCTVLIWVIFGGFTPAGAVILVLHLLALALQLAPRPKT